MEETTVLTASNPFSKVTYSCVRCADRKVRCDKENPCSACIKHNAQCHYRTPGPMGRKRKRVKEDEDKDKLKRYETLLQKLGVDLSDISQAEQPLETRGSDIPMTDDTSQMPTPASVSTEAEQSINTSQLLRSQGRSRFVENLWSRVVQEFHDSDEALEESSCEVSDASHSDDDHGFVLSVTRKPDNRSSHPSIDHIHQLWQVFIENIDPLTKIVHVPSLQPAMQQATNNLKRTPKNLEALMFAIYAVAVMSLNDDECKRRFSEPREPLLSRYILATKRALSRAKFIGTISIVVLQALVLHIFSIRNIYGPRTVWTLTGIGIRIAEGIGLHREGASLGIPPFEAEIRARIWWQLKMYDFRATELMGLAKFRGLDFDDSTCKPPANINDNKLYPGMPSPATSSTQPTDMIFFFLKTELASFARRKGARLRQQAKDVNQLDDIAARSDEKTKQKITGEVEEILEEKFLSRCDPSQPLQLLTMLVARSSIDVIRFLTHHPRRWVSQEQTPQSEREYVWRISIGLLEQCDIIQSDPRLQGFAWHSAYHLHWHALIHVLDTLRAKPLMSDMYKAWRLIEATYKNNPDMISNTKKPIHIAVGNLCLNAFNAYEVALLPNGTNNRHIPDYITKLRLQREAAKARRNLRAGSDKVMADGNGEWSQVTETKRGLDSKIFAREGELNTNEPRQNRASESAQPSWLSGGLENILYGTSNNILNVDTDFMLAQDHSLVDANDQSIDWAQWDAWLGEQNVMHADGSTSSSAKI